MSSSNSRRACTEGGRSLVAFASTASRPNDNKKQDRYPSWRVEPDCVKNDITLGISCRSRRIKHKHDFRDDNILVIDSGCDQCVRLPSFLQLCILTATYRTYDIYTS